jgi:hypothetical protein
MKKIIITVLIIALVAVGAYFLIQSLSSSDLGTNMPEGNNEEESQGTSTDVIVPQGGDEDVNGNSEGEADKKESVIGASAGGHNLTAYHFGSGEKELIFVGGIHGGYAWNTVLVAYELIDYLEESPEDIPEDIKVTVIPVLNPDGLDEIVGTTGRFSPSDVSGDITEGRFNANNVDLNRNFDCDWQETGVWQDKTVNAGSEVFSEPEARAFRDYVESNNPTAVVFWYSAAGGVFASNCHNGIPEETQAITDVYAENSGYPAYQEFDFYEITGDAVNWLAKNNIPGISVLLSDHENTEWSKNKAGIKALFEYYEN